MSPSSHDWLAPLRPHLTLAPLGEARARLAGIGRRAAEWSQSGQFYVRDSDALLDALAQLLAAAPSPVKAGTRVSVLLPDTLVRYQLLPWTPELIEREEIRQFAVERFELSGCRVREGWQVQAEWRGDGSAALAYAVSTDLLGRMAMLFESLGMTLDRVVPLAAATHYGRLRRHGGVSWSLISSGGSLTLLAYEGAQLKALLSEPCHVAQGLPLPRLLARLRVQQALATPRHIDLVGLDPVVVERALDVADDTTRSVLPLFALGRR